MNQIIPTIKLHTYQQQGTYINAFLLGYKDNYYHLQGGTSDTIYVFQESVALYVLTINRRLGYVSLNSYMASEPDPINSVFLHRPEEIMELLGAKWDCVKPLTLVKKLMECLY